MYRILFCIGLVGMVGCGRPPQPAAKVDPPKAPIMRQITVTDENGAVRTVTVPEGDYPSIPLVPMTPKKLPTEKGAVEPIRAPSATPFPVTPVKEEKPTLDGVWKSWHEVVDELDQNIKRDRDTQKSEKYRPLVQRLRGVMESLREYNPDLAHEQEEIRQVRAALKESTPKITG
jgi:hypothetical protein